MIYTSPPKIFSPRFEVVSCLAEYKNDILFLRRQDHKPQRDKWGIIAGKVDDDEDLKKAILREGCEEAGLLLYPACLQQLPTLYVKYPEYDFVYHTFHISLDFLLDEKPDVKLNPVEHKAFLWITAREALGLDLVPDMDACLKMFYKI